MDQRSDSLIKAASVRAPIAFDLMADADGRAALARDLGIRAIKKLSFKGQVEPDGADDLRLQALLGATVVQDCVVTNEPVTTRIDEEVLRRYLADMTEPEGDEVEMPEDETTDSLPETLDLNQIMAEALSLALPPWPRAEGVDPVDVTVTEPGKTPLTDEDLRPFAALKALRDPKADTDGDNG
ncbi:MAG: DUF177 domain-containing protein [Silicimonas sp.]|nr:DUF177 domain-containing protein [Silicimonas sp.]